MKHICQMIAIGITLLPAAVSAGEPLTLDDAIRRAWDQHPQLAIKHAEIDAAAGRLEQARAWPNPELELSAEDVPVNDGGLSRSQNMVGLSMTVPFPGKRTLDQQIGRDGVAIAEWELSALERELRRDVTVAFYRVLAAERKVALAGELHALSVTLADTARKRVEAGAAAPQELLRAEIEQERAAVDLEAARRDRTESQLALGLVMGAAVPISNVSGALREEIALADLDATQDAVWKDHPVLRGASADRDRAEHEWQRARRESWPDMTFGVAYGRDEAENEDVMEFRISVPLPIFDRSRGRQEEARAMADAARYRQREKLRELNGQLGGAVARFVSAQRQVESYRQRLLPKAAEAMRQVKEGFEAGKFGFLDLLDTQRTVAETNAQYVEKLLEWNMAAAELESLAAEPGKE
jgi:cobalt-zinc-cadmium efflux system outer membrane protein